MGNVSRHSRKWILIAALMSGLVLLQTVWLVQAAPDRQSPEEGRALFEQYCAGCHTIGGGDLAGPDLQGVASRRDPEWLEHWLAEPDVMLAEGDPIAVELLAQYNNIPMPNQHLTLSEIDALLAYLGVAQPSLPTAPADQAGVVGSAERGKALFAGSQTLSGGGAACIACHDSGALDMPGGGLLGPDLTQVVQRYGGEAGLRGALGTIAFPSMVPVYRDRPLTPQEQADLAAFFQQSATENNPGRLSRNLVLFMLAFGLMDVFLLLLFAWNRRLPHHARQPLSRR